jgi:hypothetical protein
VTTEIDLLKLIEKGTATRRVQQLRQIEKLHQSYQICIKHQIIPSVFDLFNLSYISHRKDNHVKASHRHASARI